MEPLKVELKFKTNKRKYGNSWVFHIPKEIEGIMPKGKTYTIAVLDAQDGWIEILSHNLNEVIA